MGMVVAVPAGSYPSVGYNGDNDRLQDAVEFQPLSSTPRLPGHHGVSVHEHVRLQSWTVQVTG